VYRHIDAENDVKNVAVSVTSQGGRPRLLVSGHQPNPEFAGGRRPRSVTINIDTESPALGASSHASPHVGDMTMSQLSVGETNSQGVAPRPKQQETTAMSSASSLSDADSARLAPRLTVDRQWMATAASHSTEALLFIHGVDHNVDDVLKRFGQLLALGRFPAYIRPFAFCWPASKNILLYWCAHNVASDNDNHRDLRSFLIALRASGVRTLHILCHSLGSRFFLRSFSTLKNMFAPVDVRATGKQSKGFKLANLVLVNPDYEVDTFIGDYETLRRHCSRVTIYTDHRCVPFLVPVFMLFHAFSCFFLLLSEKYADLAGVFVFVFFSFFSPSKETRRCG
jgi:esterase/lipase superfamily enzyme